MVPASACLPLGVGGHGWGAERSLGVWTPQQMNDSWGGALLLRASTEHASFWLRLMVGDVCLSGPLHLPVALPLEGGGVTHLGPRLPNNPPQLFQEGGGRGQGWRCAELPGLTSLPGLRVWGDPGLLPPLCPTFMGCLFWPAVQANPGHGREPVLR